MGITLGTFPRDLLGLGVASGLLWVQGLSGTPLFLFLTLLPLWGHTLGELLLSNSKLLFSKSFLPHHRPIRLTLALPQPMVKCLHSHKVLMIFFHSLGVQLTPDPFEGSQWTSSLSTGLSSFDALSDQGTTVEALLADALVDSPSVAYENSLSSRLSQLSRLLRQAGHHPVSQTNQYPDCC